MVNSLFEKLVSDEDVRIEAIEAQYDKHLLMDELDRELTEICDLYGADAFRDDDEFELALALAFERYGINEHEWQEWVLARDIP